MTSSPIVPLPAITWSPSTGCTKNPSTPGNDERSIVGHHSSNGTVIVRPPSRAMASSFVRGAVSGAMTVQGTPIDRATQATPCAMFPALAVTTPPAMSSGFAWRIALAAPRILNEPMGCRFSSFR